MIEAFEMWAWMKIDRESERWKHSNLSKGNRIIFFKSKIEVEDKPEGRCYNRKSNVKDCCEEHCVAGEVKRRKECEYS